MDEPVAVFYDKLLQKWSDFFFKKRPKYFDLFTSISFVCPHLRYIKSHFPSMHHIYPVFMTSLDNFGTLHNYHYLDLLVWSKHIIGVFKYHALRVTYRPRIRVPVRKIRVEKAWLTKIAWKKVQKILEIVLTRATKNFNGVESQAKTVSKLFVSSFGEPLVNKPLWTNRLFPKNIHQTFLYYRYILLLHWYYYYILLLHTTTT